MPGPSDKVPVRGVVLVRKNGEIIRAGKNLVVLAGYAQIASVFASVAGVRPSHMAIGASGTASSLGMTALQGTEHQRKAFDSTTLATRTLVYQATFGAGLGGQVSVQEMGLFNAAAAGDMLARWVTTSFLIDSTDVVIVTWTIIFGE